MFNSYQLTPLGLRPPPRPTRRLHASFHQKIANCIEELVDETEIVDYSHPIGKELLLTVDAVLSHGLFVADRCYWRFVKEFLPKSEQRLMEVEWSAGSKRRLSVAWLKDSFNRSSLYFQMLSFLHARAVVKKFYDENACMRNFGIFELIVFEIGKIEHVQFAFDRPRSSSSSGTDTLINDVAPVATQSEIAEILEPISEVPSSSKNHDQDELDRKFEEIVPNACTEPLPSAVDQEMILNELVRSHRQKLNGNNHYHSPSNTPDMSPHIMVPIERKEEQRLDDIIKKTISNVRLEHLDPEAKSFNSLLNMDTQSSSGPAAMNGDANTSHSTDGEALVEGEIALRPGEVLRLAMDIFVNLDEQERFQRLFHVYENFATGAPIARLLMVTDRNVYLMTQHLEAESGASLSYKAQNVPRDLLSVNYVVHTVIPIPQIDFIEMSHQAQVLVIFGRSENSFLPKEGSVATDRLAVIGCAEEELGRCIVDTIVTGAESVPYRPPDVSEPPSPFSLIQRRFLRDTLNWPDADISQLFYGFWTETTNSVLNDEQTLSGYLYRREVSAGYWRSSTTEWKQSFFVLRGSKLYVFADSSCHIGEKVIDMSMNVGGNRVQITEVLVKEQPNVIAIQSPDDTIMQISTPSGEEMHKWMTMMRVSMSSNGEDEALLSCSVMFTGTHIVMAQEGTNCYIDGFMRPLLNIKLEEIRLCLILVNEVHNVAILWVNDAFEWIFLRSEKELNRFRTLMTPLVPTHDTTTYTENDRLIPLIESFSRKFVNPFSQSVYITGCDAISDIE